MNAKEFLQKIKSYFNFEELAEEILFEEKNCENLSIDELNKLLENIKKQRQNHIYMIQRDPYFKDYNIVPMINSIYNYRIQKIEFIIKNKKM